MELCSLYTIFEKRLLRIPDYQRGYAWQNHQIKDFWEDIIRLDIRDDENKIHYAGVVTLELVKKDIWKEWKQDEWIINGIGYAPFYIVDGQQRLATSMILMQAIIERVESKDKEIKLNGQSIDDIRNKYIYISRKTEDDERKSFLFGYEKDNPSDEFLKTCIFDDGSSSDSHQKLPETIYTQNLREAKEYFKNELKEMEVKGLELATNHAPTIESIFKNLTENIKFNLYKIDNEIDTFVAFETANNRGKPLSTLELLKSRLIYLSTLPGDDADKELRTTINNAWKTIYEYLGKNPKKPLDDDDFLRNHWIMYFGYSSEDTYRNFLLDKKFIAQNITNKDIDNLTIKKYVISLEQSAEPWFYIHNPSHEDFCKFSDKETKELRNRLNGLGFDEENRKWLARLNRLGFRAFKPLLLASYVSNKKDVEKIHDLLRAMEQYNFIMFELSQYRANTGKPDFYRYAKKIKKDVSVIGEVIKDINKQIEYDWPHIHKYFYNYIERKYKLYTSKKYDRWCGGGFSAWNGLPYFLYRYEEWLRQKEKEPTEKPKCDDDIITIEHILPQNIDGTNWEEHFGKFNKDKKLYLKYSLGNLLLLSQSKNSSLKNRDFITKKNNGKGVGYYNGSASEKKVAENKDWTAKEILERGLEMLEFMEKRWKWKIDGKESLLPLGDEKSKRRLLHLDFLP